MIPRQPTRREIRVSSRPRWILIGTIVLAAIVATVDIVALNVSARAAIVAFGERFTGWTDDRTIAAPERPETDAGRARRSVQWTFLRDVGAKAASLVHEQTAISAPNVVGPSGPLHR